MLCIKLSYHLGSAGFVPPEVRSGLGFAPLQGILILVILAPRFGVIQYNTTAVIGNGEPQM